MADCKKYDGSTWRHSLRKLTTATDTITTLPADIYADGSPLIDYTIYGNMSQNGTSSPDNPIMPNGTGDRTKNYFDKDNIDLVNLYPNNSTGAVDQSSTVWSIIVPIDSGGEWIFWIEDTTINRIRIGGYETYPVLGTQGTFVDNAGTAMTDYKYNVFEAPEGTNYILIMLSSNQYTQSEMRELLETVHVQIEKGTRKTDYEPYGYKLPVETAEDILVNSLTTQEYNGLTLTRNADGSVRVQGTATANSNFFLCNDGHSAILASYQIIDNGIYYTGGGIEGGEEGKFILSAAYDDAIGGTAARRFRIPYGENIRIDNSTGAYKYLSVYISIWNGATVDFVCKPYLKAGSTTNNIYLGNVQTTRYIKKLALDGTENWNAGGDFFYNATISPDYLRARDVVTCVCTHYAAKPQRDSGVNLSDKSCSLYQGTNVQRFYVKDSAFTALADFKSFLAQQYAAGTPVTVWYILLEPETGIVNEPLRKIGNYADTVSYEQAGVEIPTNNGSTTIDVNTALKPSGIELGYTGWHDTQCKEFNGTTWE